MSWVIVIILVVVVVLALVVLSMSIRVVQEYEEGVLFRLGKVIAPRSAEVDPPTNDVADA